MDLITYETIRKVHRAEKQEQTLQKLPDNFFHLVRNWMEHKQKTFESSKDTVALLELENVKKLLEDLVNRRQRKVVISALHTVRGDVPPENLTEEEVKFFDKMVNLLKNFKQEVQEQLLGYENIVEEKIEDARKSLKDINNRKKVKILSDLPKFVDSDLKSYGPFKANESAELPVNMADVLIKRSVAEEI